LEEKQTSLPGGWKQKENHPVVKQGGHHKRIGGAEDLKDGRDVAKEVREKRQKGLGKDEEERRGGEQESLWGWSQKKSKGRGGFRQEKGGEISKVLTKGTERKGAGQRHHRFLKRKL